MTTIESLTKKYSLKEDYSKEVDEILTTIFSEAKDVDLILMRGYTPGFNDGDPCTHRTSVAVQELDDEELHYNFGVYEYSEKEQTPEEFEEGVGDFFKNLRDKHSIRLPTTSFYEWYLGKCKTREKKEMWLVKHLLETASRIFEREWGTDWQAIIWRTGKDTYKVKREAYDCGY